MPTDLFPEVTRTDLFSYEAAILRLYTGVAKTLFRTRLRAWPTTKIQAIACGTMLLNSFMYCLKPLLYNPQVLLFCTIIGNLLIISCTYLGVMLHKGIGPIDSKSCSWIVKGRI